LGSGAPAGLGGPDQSSALTALVDTNVLVRHLTGDPPGPARRATDFLAARHDLLLADLIVAECVYVLESFYNVEPARVATLMRAAIALPGVRVQSGDLLLRALELYEREQLHFAEAYLVASAEITGVGAVASFDETVDRVASVRRIAP
jgi:predicted nucleic acid-binding protein